jgi:hypothetical protein
MAENKSNTQYFERALSKSLTKFGHTTLKEQQKSCIRKLVVDSHARPKMSVPFYQLASAKVLFIRSYRRCFLSYIAFVMVYDKEFRYCCFYPVRNCISASSKLRPWESLANGSQAVCLDPSFINDETNDFSVFSWRTLIPIAESRSQRTKLFAFSPCTELTKSLFAVRLKVLYSPYVNKAFVYIFVSKILCFIRQLFIFSSF